MALESRLKKHQSQYESTNYLIVAGYEHGDLVVAVAFLPNISQKEMAKAYLHSKMIQVALASVSKRDTNNQSNNTKELELVRKAEEIAEHDLKLCWQLLQDGTWIKQNVLPRDMGYLLRLDEYKNLLISFAEFIPLSTFHHQVEPFLPRKCIR